jgi:hypothetical protein
MVMSRPRRYGTIIGELMRRHAAFVKLDNAQLLEAINRPRRSLARTFSP